MYLVCVGVACCCRISDAKSISSNGVFLQQLLLLSLIGDGAHEVFLLLIVPAVSHQDQNSFVITTN